MFKFIIIFAGSPKALLGQVGKGRFWLGAPSNDRQPANSFYVFVFFKEASNLLSGLVG